MWCRELKIHYLLDVRLIIIMNKKRQMIPRPVWLSWISRKLRSHRGIFQISSKGLPLLSPKEPQKKKTKTKTKKKVKVALSWTLRSCRRRLFHLHGWYVWYWKVAINFPLNVPTSNEGSHISKKIKQYTNFTTLNLQICHKL